MTRRCPWRCAAPCLRPLGTAACVNRTWWRRVLLRPSPLAGVPLAAAACGAALARPGVLGAGPRAAGRLHPLPSALALHVPRRAPAPSPAPAPEPRDALLPARPGVLYSAPAAADCAGARGPGNGDAPREGHARKRLPRPQTKLGAGCARALALTLLHLGCMLGTLWAASQPTQSACALPTGNLPNATSLSKGLVGRARTCLLCLLMSSVWLASVRMHDIQDIGGAFVLALVHSHAEPEPPPLLSVVRACRFAVNARPRCRGNGITRGVLVLVLVLVLDFEIQLSGCGMRLRRSCMCDDSQG